MTERSQVFLSTLLGAVVGAVVGGLYLTERGSRVRARIEPALDDFVAEIDRARGTVERARHAAREGRRAFEDVIAAAQAAEAAGDRAPAAAAAPRDRGPAAVPRVRDVSS